MSKKIEETNDAPPAKAPRLHVESDVRAGVCTLPSGQVVRATKETCEANGWTWTPPPPTK